MAGVGGKPCGMEGRWWILCVVLMLMQVTGISTDKGYFWHITDFHYDFTYDDLQLSCNRDNRPSSPGQYGDFWCDSPWALVNNSISAMAAIKPDVDFLIWTGDTVLHAHDDQLNYTINKDILDNVTDALKSAFPAKSVYATFGNHDYHPNDQFPPHNDRIYNDSLDRWRDWIGDASQDDNFRQGGYYTVKISPKLRLIALNTNLYYTSNKAVKNHPDPAGQFEWLEEVLHNATDDEKLMIIGHVPPGVHTPNGLLWMYENYNDRLVSILRNYTFKISAMHFGHDHADGFKIMPAWAGGPPGCAIFIAPSVTPWRYVIPGKVGPAHNPGVRLVEFDKDTGEHLSIQQYYLDLVEANEKGAAKWKLEYNTADVYNWTKPLRGSHVQYQSLRMHDANSEEFKNYWKFYTVSPPAELQEKCDETCHASIICGFTEFSLARFEKCKSKMISVGVSFHTCKASFVLASLLTIMYFLF